MIKTTNVYDGLSILSPAGFYFKKYIPNECIDNYFNINTIMGGQRPPILRFL